jgi:hypothetical protein
MDFFIEPLKFLFAFLVIWATYMDAKRILRAFFMHVERKLLIIHALKLGVFLLVIYRFSGFIPFYRTIVVFICVLMLVFLSILTLKQVELGIKDIRNPIKVTFKYGSKLTAYIVYLVAVLINFGELKNNKSEIKEKSIEMIYMTVSPVQKYIAISISGLGFTNRKIKFITDIELNEIKTKLEPGDILLKRNDWQGTNLGIPGFWTHTGIYLGSPEEMDNYFRDVKGLDGESLSEKLKSINEIIYYEMLREDEKYVIEAIEEGVAAKPLSHIARVDYFSALRPRITREEKLKAILKAYSFVGRPYDFSFNINTDDAFICTEVIEKAFGESITFKRDQRLGKKTIFPNSIAQKFTLERRRANRELDFVLFYDLDIKTRKAFKSNESGFARSSKRSIVYYKKIDLFRYISTTIDLTHMDR